MNEEQKNEDPKEKTEKKDFAYWQTKARRQKTLLDLKIEIQEFAARTIAKIDEIIEAEKEKS